MAWVCMNPECPAAGEVVEADPPECWECGLKMKMAAANDNGVPPQPFTGHDSDPA